MTDFDFPEPTDVAKELAKRIAPKLATELAERKDAIIEQSGGWGAKAAVGIAWPVAMRMLPTVTEAGVDAMLDQFGTLTVGEIAGMVVEHLRAKHQPVPSHFLQRLG